MNKSIKTIVLIKLLIIFNNFATINCQNNYEKYEGYKIYELHLENEEQLLEFQENFNDLMPPLTINRLNYSITVLLPSTNELDFLKYLENNHIYSKIINQNVAETIRNERKFKETQKLSRTSNIINFQNYQRFDVINNYLDYLEMQYPERVKLINVGKSYEGRNMRAILISNNSNTQEITEKPLIFIDAGIHAREWIAPATALFVMQQLVENSTYYESELNMYDWLIWPLVNPDGYEYTHEQDRLWRKNRRPFTNQNTSSCVGADLNRNFDYFWSFSGVSNKECSDIYAGPQAFSEPESRALRDLLLGINATCSMYLTLHSYGNYLLYSWGYDKLLPPSWPYLDAVAQAGSTAIRKFSGTLYTVGGAANVLYPASGASDDYAFGVAKIPVVICMELPSGGNGFDPPADTIQSIVEESWMGIRAMALETHEYPLRNMANCKVFSFVIMLCVIVVLRV